MASKLLLAIFLICHQLIIHDKASKGNRKIFEIFLEVLVFKGFIQKMRIHITEEPVISLSSNRKTAPSRIGTNFKD
jgi:hypothetical protein